MFPFSLSSLFLSLAPSSLLFFQLTPLADVGEVYTWGVGTYGQLGHGTFSDLNSGISGTCMRICTLLLLLFLALALSLSLTFHPTKLMYASKLFFFFSFFFSLLVDYFTFTPKRVKEALFNKRVSRIACGTYHTVALTDDGQVYTWVSCGKPQRQSFVFSSFFLYGFFPTALHCPLSHFSA